MNIDRLLDLYEDARERGEPITPEALCRDCPELLPQLRAELAALESLDGLLGGGAAPVDLSEAGRYRPTTLHARGGLGEVYKADDTELGREVALKRTQRRDLHDRFVREAEITGRLEHPAIVPVYGLGRDARGRPFYAMRFVRGETLDQAIDRGENVRTLLRKFGTVCEAVAYAHDRGVVHRDIKPQNIMLGPFGETMLVDWGLAKPVADAESNSDTDPGVDSAEVGPLAEVEATRVGVGKGSPAFMSPEQARGESVGPAADVFALGATLRKILTGVPRGSLEEVPKPLAAVCRKAMADAPSARYGVVLDLARDIERWLNDEPVSAWREPWSVRMRRRVQRHRTLVVGAVAALLVAAIAGAMFAYAERENGRELTAANRRETAQRREAERASYRAGITTAQLCLDGDRPNAAWRTLRGVPEQRRAFEWHLLRRRVRADLLRVSGYGSSWHVRGNALVLRPDVAIDLAPLRWGECAEREIGHFQFDGIAIRRDGAELVLPSGQRFKAAHGVLSRDGARFAYKYADSLRVLELATGRELYVARGPNLLSFGFSGNGARLAYAKGIARPEVVVVDLGGGRVSRRISGRVRAFALNETGDRLATTRLAVYSVPTGVAEHKDESRKYMSVLYLRDGRLVAGDEHGRLRVLDKTGRSLMDILAHRGPVLELAEGPGVIVSRAEWMYKVWDAHRGDGTRLARAHDGAVGGVAVCGPWIVSGRNEVRVWSVADRRLHREIQTFHDGSQVGFRVAAIRGVGAHVVVATRHHLVWLDPASGDVVRTERFENPIRQLAVSGDRVAIETATPEFLAGQRWVHVVGAWKTKIPVRSGLQADNDALHFDGDRLISGTNVFDVDTGAIVGSVPSARARLVANARRVHYEEDPLGRNYVVVADESGNEIIRFATHGRIHSIAFRDGMIVTGHENGDLGVWQGAPQGPR